MNIVIFGGSGHIGSAVTRWMTDAGHDVTIVSRRMVRDVDWLPWDGVTLGPWAKAIEGVDAVLNLTGQPVMGLHTPEYLKQIFESRIRPTQLVGEAIAQAERPPRVWLQSSTAHIYDPHADSPFDENCQIDDESYWNVRVFRAWEKALFEADTPHTRRIAIRSALVMMVGEGSGFGIFSKLARLGIGGTLASGRQWVSWIHEFDFCAALLFFIEHPELEGSINVCSPNPLPQREFARILRDAWHVPFGLRASEWMVRLGAWTMRVEPQPVLDSIRATPGRLSEAGFEFLYPTWQPAAAELVERTCASYRKRLTHGRQ